MSEDSFGAVPLSSVETPLPTGTDAFADLTAKLDVARNQFRTRRFQEVSAACVQIVASAERNLSIAAGRLNSEDTKRISLVLASALTLDGRCAEEMEQPDRAQELWARAVKIFDDNLGTSGQPEEGILTKFGRGVGLLAAEDPKKNVPGDLLVYYGAALRMVGRRQEAIAVLRQVTQMPSFPPETYRHLGLALNEEGEYAKAVEELNKGLEGAPSDRGTWFGLAAAEKALGHNQEAARAYLGLAQARLATGQVERALTATEDSLRLERSDPVALRFRGDLLRLLGRFEDSLATIDQALQLSPEDPFTWTIKGATLFGLNRLTDALSAFDAALKANPQDARTLTMKGEVLFTLQRYREAEEALQKSVSLNPGFASTFAVLGSVLLKLDRPAEALEQAGKALNLRPSARAWQVQGESLFRLQRYQDALQSYDRAGELSGGLSASCSIAVGRAEVLAALGRLEEALRVLDQVLQKDPGNTSALIHKGKILWWNSGLNRQREGAELLAKAAKLHPTVAEATGIAPILAGAGFPEEALASANLALQSADSPPSIFFDKAQALQSLNRHEEALAAAEEGLRRTPDSPSAIGLGLKGVSLEALGRTDEAVRVLDDSTRLDPNLDWTWRALCRLLYLRNPEEALKAATRSLELKPDDPQTIASRGFVYHSMGKRQEAEADLKHAVALNPELDWAYAELASVQRELDKPEEALSAVNSALKIKPEYTAALEIKGEIFVGIGEFEAALRVFNRVKEESAASHFWKGLAFDSLDQRGEARECYEKALAGDPQDIWTIRALADILLLLGETGRACNMFDEILSERLKSPANIYEIGLSGWCHYGCRRLDRAIQFYSEALAMDHYAVLKSGQFDLALLLTCSERYSLAFREYRRAIDLARTAHKWLQKNLFRVAILDLERAREIRYPAIASAPETQKVLEQLKGELQLLSAAPNRPPLD